MRLFQLILFSLSMLFAWLFYLGLLIPIDAIPWAFITVSLFLGVGFLTILSRVYLSWFIRDDESPIYETLEAPIFFFMGFFSFLLLSLFFREAIWVGLWMLKKDPAFAHGPLSVALVIGLSFTFYLAGTLKAKSGPRTVEKLIVAPPSFPKDFKIRIAQISDLHVGSQIGPAYVTKVVERTNALNPDLIMLTGDIGDGTPERHIPSIQLLKTLRAKYGIFYVNGNHEYYRGETEWSQAFKDLGFQVLQNSSATIKVGSTQVSVVGTTDFQSNLPAALMGVDPAAYKILLAHRPDLADRAAERGVHLQLSGHTHNGQFIPWTWMIRLFHRYTYGLYKIGSMNLYVNSGTGYWGPALRLGTQSEISLLEVRSVKA